MEFRDDPATTELVTRAREGDNAAWRQIVSHHDARLRRLVRLRLNPRLAARLDPQDIVQDAFLDAFESLGTFPQERVSFRGWLRQLLLKRVYLAHRTHLGTQARSVKRQAGGRPRSGSGDEGLAWIGHLLDSGTTPSRHAIRDEDGRLVREALGRLPELDREILSLFFIEKHSHREIGLILNLGADAVKARQYRALRCLTSLLRRAHPEWCHDSCSPT